MTDALGNDLLLAPTKSLSRPVLPSIVILLLRLRPLRVSLYVSFTAAFTVCLAAGHVPLRLANGIIRNRFCLCVSRSPRAGVALSWRSSHVVQGARERASGGVTCRKFSWNSINTIACHCCATSSIISPVHSDPPHSVRSSRSHLMLMQIDCCP